MIKTYLLITANTLASLLIINFDGIGKLGFYIDFGEQVSALVVTYGLIKLALLWIYIPLKLAFLWRIVTLCEERRLPLHADVYMPMLRAAHNARDTEAARDLISMREDGEPALFPLRQNQRNAVLGLEEEVESWLASKAERGVAA